MEIRGSCAIVTGASSGIGLATARLLTAQGARVALVSRSRERLEELMEEMPGSICIVADISVGPQVRGMIAEAHRQFGRIDILVNNAGRGYYAPVEKIDTMTFRELFELNVMGQLIAMQGVIPLMRLQGEGAIVNVSSGTALDYYPSIGAYSATKRALTGLALTARAELLERDNISVSVIYPYLTATDFGKNVMQAPGSQGRARDLPRGDPPELVAEKILELIETGEAESFAHEWMREGR